MKLKNNRFWSLSRFRKTKLMRGVGLSRAAVGGGPVLKREYGGPRWYRNINGVWWATGRYTYFLEFRRRYAWYWKTSG